MVAGSDRMANTEYLMRARPRLVLREEPLPRTKVTRKYQITIPKLVRDKLDIKPGEVVTIEAISESEIQVKRHPTVMEPLNILIGKKTRQHIPIGKLEEKIESR